MSTERYRARHRGPFPATQVDHFLQVFYSWEYRGRGWVLYDEPVNLEPPFRPFYWYAPPCRAAIDDGRKHTFLSGLVAGVRDLIVGGSNKNADTSLAEPEEPDPVPLENSPDLIEIQVTLPPDTKISRETSEHFLRSLTHCRHPLAFEIIGTPGEVVFQITCSEEDYSHVENQLQGQFPDSVHTQQTDHLTNTWGAAGEEVVVVDFGLSHEFMLPLATSRSFDPDPLTAVVSALSDLRNGEVGVFQVLFQPTTKPWVESVQHAVMDDEGDPIFENFPNLLPLVEEKLSSPLYACIVRAAGRSDKLKRVWKTVRGLGAALSQYSYPGSNELIPLSTEGYASYDQEFGLLLRYSHRTGMLLNVEELLSFTHLPSASVRAKKLKRVLTTTRFAPENARGHSFVLGENVHNGVATPVTLSSEQRSKHLYTIGASGTGKSTFLLHLIRQDLEQGNGFAVLDPHGDLIDSIVGFVPAHRLKDVILLDPSDEEFSIGLNILGASSEQEKILLSSDLVSVFRRLSTSWGDQMTSVFSNAIQAFLESDRGGTLIDLRSFLVDREFRTKFLESVQDSEVVYYWLKTFPLLSGRPQGPILTRLDTFLRPKPIRYMVAQKESKLDVRRVMDEGKILLARLSQGAIGEENAYLLGSLLVSKIHQAAMGRQEQKESERRPFYLYVDECHNFLTPSMNSILSGARKYRLSLILAHQELQQLGGKDLASAVLTNPFTRVAFRLGDQDAKKVAEGFSHFDANDLQNLSVGEAIARVERAEYDFNLSIPRLPEVNVWKREANRERVLANTREKYATARAVVEEDLSERRAELFATAERPATPRKRKVSTAEPPPQEEGNVLQLPERRIGPKEEPPVGEVQAPEEPDAPIVSAPRPRPPIPSLPGRGKSEHKYQQRMVKLQGEELGFRVTVEKLLPSGGSVDVALESNQRKIACEISVTTPDEHEMGNIRKCLEAGFDEIALIAGDAKRARKLAELVESTFANEKEKVQCYTMPDFLLHLKEIAASSQNKIATIKGFQVKSTHKVVSDEDKRRKKDLIAKVISKTIAQSMMRPKKEGEGG